MAAEKTSYVCKLTAEQAGKLKDLLLDQGWKLDDLPYAHWRAQKDKTTVAAYLSGKCTVQGKGTAELVQFVLEPLFLGEARFGYEDVWAKQDHPEMFEPHAGIDESGKGDFFGPLVICACYVDERMAEVLIEAGVTDSKKIGSDARMAGLASKIREVTGGRFALVRIGPEAYNRMYAQNSNVNRVLAWGHARALEDLLAKVPDCPRALSDQFGPKSRVQQALMTKGRAIKLEQRPKAEADIAVAAASVLARHEFVVGMKRLGEAAGLTLPKGASSAVIEAAKELIKKHGEGALGRYAKLHFRTTNVVRGELGLAPLPGVGGRDEADAE